MIRVLVIAAVLCVAALAQAEQRWQCGDGVSVPLIGSREAREAACRDAREQAKRPPQPLPPDRERALRQRIERLEKQYGVDIDAETR